MRQWSRGDPSSFWSSLECSYERIECFHGRRLDTDFSEFVGEGVGWEEDGECGEVQEYLFLKNGEGLLAVELESGNIMGNIEYL